MKKNPIYAQISLLSVLLAIVIFSFTPQKAQAYSHEATVNCIDIENYGSGGKRTRVCAASNCAWENHDQSENWGTCTITIE